MFSWGNKKEITLLPRDDINGACEIFEKVIIEEAQRENLDLIALGPNMDLFGDRKHKIYSRYIRACGYRLEDCKNMLLNSIKWRLVTKPESVTTEDVFEALNRDYVFFHEEDRQGNPIVWVNVQYHLEYADKQPVYQKFVLFMMEEGYRRVARVLDAFQAQNPDKPLPDIKATLVFDMRGFGMANMDFAIVRYLADTLKIHYPEVLAHTYIVDAPWIFSACWGLIKGWLDPAVAAKIEFLNRQELIKNIDPEKVPLGNGGTAVNKKLWLAKRGGEEKGDEEKEEKEEKDKEEKKGDD